jgi:hypothetical protein
MAEQLRGPKWIHLIYSESELRGGAMTVSFEVPPLAGDALLTTFHPLLRIAEQAVLNPRPFQTDLVVAPPS